MQFIRHNYNFRMFFLMAALVGSGYVYWIKMNAPGMLTYPAETR